MTEFYTYIYFVDGEPQYVGKGKKNRKYDHEKRSTHFGYHVAKAIREGRQVCILTILEPSEDDAFAEEKRLIALHGRKDLGTGSLYNLTDGGDGLAGVVRTEEYRANLSKAIKQFHAAQDKATVTKVQQGAQNRAEVQAKRKASMNTPECKALRRAAQQKPEVLAKRLAKFNETVARRRAAAVQ